MKSNNHLSKTLNNEAVLTNFSQYVIIPFRENMSFILTELTITIICEINVTNVYNLCPFSSEMQSSEYELRKLLYTSCVNKYSLFLLLGVVHIQYMIKKLTRYDLVDRYDFGKSPLFYCVENCVGDGAFSLTKFVLCS